MASKPYHDGNNKAAATATLEVLKIDNTLSAGRNESTDWRYQTGLIIDEMGKMSAVAQELKAPITSADKLVNSNHVIYMMTEHDRPTHFSVIGFLNMGWTKLCVCDKAGFRTEATVFCMFDFYIHEFKQRKGYGKRLIEYMLRDVGLDAARLVIDKPTYKLLQFMCKHFNLWKLVNQGNNFGIYEEFFISPFYADDVGNRALAYHQPVFGRHEAHKHHDTMGEIVHGQDNAGFVNFKRNNGNELVNSQLKEVNPRPQHESEGTLQTDKYGNPVNRDLKFRHNSLW